MAKAKTQTKKSAPTISTIITGRMDSIPQRLNDKNTAKDQLGELASIFASIIAAIPNATLADTLDALNADDTFKATCNSYWKIGARARGILQTGKGKKQSDYEEMIAKGLSPEDASRFSGYTPPKA